MYKNLISKVSEGHFFDLYNLAETKMPSTTEKYFDEKWYKDFIQKPIREFIYKAKIVEIEGESSEKKTLEELWFPIKSFTKPVKEKIWQFVFDLYPNIVCKRTHLHNWCDIYWENGKTINYQILVNSIEKLENIHKLSQALKKSEDDTFDWLNLLGNFILEDDSNLALFEKDAIIPNQNGIFKKKIHLYTDEIKDDELIDIIELLGEDWKDILRHDSINFGTYRSKDKKDIAVKITEKLKNPYNSDDVIKAISLLCEWFENNPAQGKDLFAQLYSKRAELFMNTIKDKESLYKVMRNCTDLSKLAQVVKAIGDNPKIIESLEKIEEVTKLLQEFNADDISDLKKMLISAQNISTNNSKILITQETLVSLGVKSLKELEEALEDNDFASQFIHTSTPTEEMFIYAQGLISRAKTNVIEYLKKHPKYACEEWQELAPTVIGGFKKDGLSISVVVRPSDNREVIVYYVSEKDTLDTPNAELWIDNGVDEPRHLTLGKILKITGINRIPV